MIYVQIIAVIVLRVLEIREHLMRTSTVTANSVSSLVKSKITRFNRGRVFTPDNLNISGSREAILRALSRLVVSGVIKRVYKGVYYKPEISTLFKGRPLPPSLSETVKVISRANGEKIQVHGALAANKLGLSNQVPMIKVFYTSGPTREIVIGGSRVKFVHTSNEALFEAKEPAVAMAVAAMYYLGKDLVDKEKVERIKSNLTEDQFEKLKEMKLTGWMKSALHAA